MPPTETAAPAGNATESSATPFEQDLGAMFGDYSTAGETPEPSESATESTSVEPVDATAPETASTTAAAADSAIVSASDGTPPAAQATAPIDDDPFKDTTPATYVVNGQSVPVEDIRVFKEGGAVIRPESLPNVLSKLAERDTLSEKYRTRDSEYQTLSKVGEWTGADNQTVTGPAAIIERIVAHAAVLSENQLLVSEILKSPDLHAAGLLMTELRPDGKGGQYEAVIFRPDAIANLQTQNELRQLKSAQAIRDHYKTVVASASKVAPAPLDTATATPQLVKLVADSAKLDASVLTPADRAMFAKQLPFHLKDGLASLEWQELVKERIQLRAEQKTASQQLVTTTTNAVKQGQAAMAAAARGVKPTSATKTAAPVKSPTAAQERQQNEGDLYDSMQRAASKALRAAG